MDGVVSTSRISGCMDGVVSTSRIEVVAVIETPLKGALGLSDAGFHAFVLFFVNGYFVTFEKHEGGLTIQISKDFKLVVLKYMNDNRKTPMNLATIDYGTKTIQQLAKLIAKKNFAFEEYNAPGGIHCKKFAGDVFDTVAKKKVYNWKSGETMARGSAITTVVAVGAGFFFGPIHAAMTALGGAIITTISTIPADVETKKRRTDLNRNGFRKKYSNETFSNKKEICQRHLS